MHFARFVQFVIVAVSLIGASHGNAVVYGTYWDSDSSIISGFCGSGNQFCAVGFAQVPSDKLLLATNVACKVTTTGAPVNGAILVVYTQPTANQLGGRNHPLQLPPPITAGASFTMGINHPINFLIGGTRYPVISFVTSAPPTSSWNVTCHLSGNLINP